LTTFTGIPKGIIRSQVTPKRVVAEVVVVVVVVVVVHVDVTKLYSCTVTNE